MFFNLPAFCRELEQPWQLAAGESGVDADMHVVPRDMVDQRVQKLSLEMRKFSTGGLTENEHPETGTERSYLLQRPGFKMVEKEICDKDPALQFILDGEEVPLMPVHAGRNAGRAGGEVDGLNRIAGKAVRDFFEQCAITRSDFSDPAGGEFRKTAQGPDDPAIISHQAVDHPEIPPAADRPWIFGWQVIENFRNDGTHAPTLGTDRVSSNFER
jgi:hypothetical protein